MKKLFYMALATIILVSALATSAQAQNGSSLRIIASIPFTFNVGKTSLPAGRYTVTVLNTNSDRRILQIRSANGRASAMTLTTDVIGEVADNAKLVFERDGDHYYFVQAQMAGDATSLAAVRTKTQSAEKERVATGKKKNRIVIVAG